MSDLHITVFLFHRGIFGNAFVPRHQRHTLQWVLAVINSNSQKFFSTECRSSLQSSLSEETWSFVVAVLIDFLNSCLRSKMQFQSGLSVQRPSLCCNRCSERCRFSSRCTMVPEVILRELRAFAWECCMTKQLLFWSN